MAKNKKKSRKSLEGLFAVAVARSGARSKTKRVVDTQSLILANEDFAKALERGEKWAVDHLHKSEELNNGSSCAFERKFDGEKRRWCSKCPFPDGCVMCNLN